MPYAYADAAAIRHAIIRRCLRCHVSPRLLFYVPLVTRLPPNTFYITPFHHPLPRVSTIIYTVPLRHDATYQEFFAAQAMPALCCFRRPITLVKIRLCLSSAIIIVANIIITRVPHMIHATHVVVIADTTT